MCNGSTKSRRKKIFEEIKAKKFPSLLKNNNLHIQENQQTPKRIHIQTHHNKNAESQSQGENLESSIKLIK